MTIRAGSFVRNDTGFSIAGSLDMSGTKVLSNIFGGNVSLGPVTVVNSHFENNVGTGDYSTAGGLSYNNSFGNSLTIDHSAFISNSWGGVYVGGYGGPTIVSNTLFERNTNSYGGGGLTLDYQSSLIVTGSIFISNMGGTFGGGGISIIGDLTTINTRFEGNTTSTQLDFIHQNLVNRHNTTLL